MKFSYILLILVCVSGMIVLVDLILCCYKRKDSVSKTPILVEYSRFLFPILLVILLVRSFCYAPYRVPTKALEPTVLSGDVVLVAKGYFAGQIHRGDIVALRHPLYRAATLIKRIIGVPGDQISYVNKTLYINGVKCGLTELKPVKNGRILYRENLIGKSHRIYLMPQVSSTNFYNLKVPQNSYFVMGDNRDASDDSRYWGFVPKTDIIGKAKFVWWSWNKSSPSLLHKVRIKRIGTHLS